MKFYPLLWDKLCPKSFVPKRSFIRSIPWQVVLRLRPVGETGSELGRVELVAPISGQLGRVQTLVRQRLCRKSNMLQFKGVFTRNTNFVSRDTIRNNPIVVVQCRATSSDMKFMFRANSP
jgi:hypothetical protein